MQFTKTPTFNTESSIFKSNSSYLNEKNLLFMNRQQVQTNSPYIMLTGVNNENALKLNNFFKTFGIIQDYIKKPQDASLLLRYKSEESLRQALNYWEKERFNFPQVILSIIHEEQKNQLFQKDINYSAQNYPRNQMNYSTNRLPQYIDDKSLKEKFIDVLLNI